MSCVVSSCEDLLPIDVSHALMEVMCEQLQNVLHAFHQQQTAERKDLDAGSKSAKLVGMKYKNYSILNTTGKKSCKEHKGMSGIIFRQIQYFYNHFIKGPCLSTISTSVMLLGMESSKVVESQLADFLVFVRRVLSLRVMKRLSTFVKWIDPLMAIISQKCSLGEVLLKFLQQLF